jgi:hypothetical protein
MRQLIAASLAATALFLSACASTTVVPPSEMPPTPLGAAAVALSAPGPVGVSVTPGSMTGVYGCPLAYEIYAPETPATNVTVLLAHGFGRNLTNMRGWARLWASSGVRTIIMTLCNSTPFAGNHDRNAADMKLLADTLAQGPVLYAGFSAGGLASLIAAARDPRAVAYLGLDAVDSGNLAGPAARALSVPALFVLGMPSGCNAEGNIAPLVPTMGTASAVRIRATVHCMFEDPSDAACAALCGSVEPQAARDQSATVIKAIATAWILDRTKAAPTGGPLLADVFAGGASWEKRVDILRAP